MNPLSKIFALALCIPAVSAQAQSDQRRYVIEHGASKVEAKVAFLGLASKTARFPDMSGSLTLSPSNFTVLHMSVDIDARTLTTGDMATKMLRGPQFFNVTRYPTVHFTAERMELTGERSAKVSGKMTARGITRPITLSIGFSLPPASTSGGEPLSIVGDTTIDRRDFGMTAFPLVVGNKVKITIRARMLPG